MALKRGGPGVLSLQGGLATTIQTVRRSGSTLTIDCAKGLTAMHTLHANITVPPPLNPVPGAVLNFFALQGNTNYTIGFDPIFKTAGAFTVKPLHFSSIRFVYTGLYWFQLGGAAINVPL